MYIWEIARLEAKKEDGIPVGVVIGIKCILGEDSTYIDWYAPKEDIPAAGATPTKAELKAYIKGYLKTNVNEGELDENEDPLPSLTRAQKMKDSINPVEVTLSEDATIPQNERTITLEGE